MVIIGELNGKVVMTKKKNLVYNIFSMYIVYYWIQSYEIILFYVLKMSHREPFLFWSIQ